MDRRFSLAGGMILATAMVIGACWFWSMSYPSPGQRSFEIARVWSPRCAAIAAWAIGHAALAGICFPRLYQPRGIYLGAAACSGGVGVLSMVCAVALLLACR